jgi:hypothetical protein
VSGVTVGTLGSPWRATVTPYGEVQPWEGEPLSWWVAADDRWHTPADEPSVRQRGIDGTPVLETRLHVPGGDAIHRAYVVADHGGLLVVEVENASVLPFAVAFGRRDLLTSRPPTDVPAHDIALPPDHVVLPVGHRAKVRVALAMDGSGPGSLPDGLPAAAQVARGWLVRSEQGIRLTLPDAELTATVVAERCRLLLEGPPLPDEDPAGFVLGAAELCRLGEPAGPWVPEVAAAAQQVARGRRHSAAAWDDGAAIDAARDVLRRAGDEWAARDAARLRDRLEPFGPAPDDPPSGPRRLAWVVDALVHPTAAGADLLSGFPAAWLGQGLEVHGAPAGDGTLSFAVRWHGARPALLWEATEPVRLTCTRLDPSWSSDALRGEALLGVPPQELTTAPR